MLIQTIQAGQAIAFKDLFVPVVRTAKDEAALATAEYLASRSNGRFTALLAQPLPGEFLAADPLGSGELWGAILGELRLEAVREAERLKERLAKAACTTEFRSTPLDFFLTRETALMSARHADLTIMQRPVGAGDEAFRNDIFEFVLFQSGRPVLIIPPTYGKEPVFKRIVIGWDASREAARAVGDAAAFVDNAETVTIVTVDASPRTLGLGEVPGADLAAHLAHRGAKVEIRNVSSANRSDGRALLDTAIELNADLIVIGGYGHNRLKEFVLGGVTREALHSSEIPLLMSH
jgi:nucleotide-binding universal stress UspA family protein